MKTVMAMGDGMTAAASLVRLSQAINQFAEVARQQRSIARRVANYCSLFPHAFCISESTVCRCSKERAGLQGAADSPVVVSQMTLDFRCHYFILLFILSGVEFNEGKLSQCT